MLDVGPEPVALICSLSMDCVDLRDYSVGQCLDFFRCAYGFLRIRDGSRFCRGTVNYARGYLAMNASEFGVCFSCLACSSISQLFMKGAAISSGPMQRLIRLGVAGGLQLLSISLAVVALQTLRLSQIVPFAAGAYLLVPLGSHKLFGECLRPSFWLGSLLIIFGILCTLA